MPTLVQLEDALKNAHAAGDTAAAQKLADAIVQMRGQSKGDPSRWSVFNEAMDTLTMGGQTKANAAFTGLLDATKGAVQGNGWNWSDNYNKRLEEERANQAAFNQEAPVRSAIGTGAGIALGIAKAPMLGRGLMGAATTGAGYGSIGGALQDANSIRERLMNTGMGAALGAGIGGVGYGAAKAIEPVITKGINVGKAMFPPPDIKAQAQVYQAAQKAGLPAVQQRLAELGPDAVNADVLGKRGIALGRGAANINPDAREIIEGVMGARKAGQNVRLATDIESASGLPVGNRKDVEALKKEAYDAVKPAIDKAYADARAAGFDLKPLKFKDILATPMGRKAFDAALNSVKNRNYNKPYLKTLGPKGQIIDSKRNYSNLELLDQVKRELDQMGKAAKRAGEADTASQAEGLARDVRQRMDSMLQGSEYELARGLRKDAYKVDEAYDMGADLGAPRVPLGLPGAASKADPALKPHIAKAYGATKIADLLNKNSTEGAMNSLNTPMGREALTAALGPNAGKVEKSLARERAFNVTNRELTGNSSTARQISEMAGVGLGTAGASMLMGFDPYTSGIAGALAGATRRAIPAISKRLVTEGQRKTAPYIAEILMKNGIPTNKPVTPGMIQALPQSAKDQIVKALMYGVAQNTRPQTAFEKK